MTTKSLLILATASLLSAAAVAEEASPLTFNIGAVSDYRYRGISQTKLKPAIQGGIDYSKDGFYVGTWASTIRWIKELGTAGGFNAGSANLEWDIYGGYKGDIIKDTLSYD